MEQWNNASGEKQQVPAKEMLYARRTAIKKISENFESEGWLYKFIRVQALTIKLVIDVNRLLVLV